MNTKKYMKILFLLICVLVVYAEKTKAQHNLVVDHKGNKVTVNNNVTTAATAPTTPAPLIGDIWFDTTNANDVVVKVWDGTAWKETGYNKLTGGSILLGNGTNIIPLAANGNKQILIGNGATLASVTVQGDVTIDNGGNTTITANAIDKGEEISSNALGSGLGKDASNKLAVDFASLTLADANILVGNSSNIATPVTMSGDVTISNLGATTIEDNSVDGTDISIANEATGAMMYYDGTDWVRLAAGTANQYLKMNTGATAPEWVDLSTDKHFTATIATDGDWEDEVIPIWAAPLTGATITQINVTTTGGGTLQFNLEERAWGSVSTAGTVLTGNAISATLGGDEITTTSSPAISNADIAAKAHLVFTTAASNVVTGSVEFVSITVYYR